MIRLDIQGVNYTSIGRYIDSQDGIVTYASTYENKKDFRLFLKSEEPIIILFTLGTYKLYLKDQFASSFQKEVINLGGDKIEAFLLKYYPDYELAEIFEDFNFGKYASHNQKTNELPELKYNGIIIPNEDFNFGDHVFIKSDSYSEFISELNEVKNEILKELF